MKRRHEKSPRQRALSRKPFGEWELPAPFTLNYNIRLLSFEWGLKNLKKKLLFLIAICIVSSFTIISTSFMNYTSKKEKNQRFEIYIVQPGDTLWKIAKRYNKQGEDIRKLIYEIRKHNDITPVIHAGQVIEIPVDRNVD